MDIGKLLSIFNSDQLIIVILGLFALIGWLAKLLIKDKVSHYKDKGEKAISNITSLESKFKDLDGKIDSIIKMIEKNDKVTRALLYKDCLREAKYWQEKKYITAEAKLQFDRFWKWYTDLGDGFGNDPEDIVNNLEIRIH